MLIAAREGDMRVAGDGRRPQDVRGIRTAGMPGVVIADAGIGRRGVRDAHR